MFGAQWGLENNGVVRAITPNAVEDSDIDAVDAWRVTKGAGVTIAVVDTAIHTQHPDLLHNIAPGAPDVPDFVGAEACDAPEPAPDHGTQIAGIAAAEENGTGGIGVAPQAQVLPVRALDNCGNGKPDSVVQAL